MSDPQYVLDVNGATYPVTDVTFIATSFDVPDGAIGSLVSFDTPDDVNLSQGVTSFTISEFVGGTEVGAITASDLTASYSFGLGHSYTLGTVYGEEAIALNLTVDGEFDQAKPCFAAGTLIATIEGYRSVESLVPGNIALLADGQTSEIVWIGHRRQLQGEAIRVCRHALGHNTPIRDLIVSDDHGLHFGDVLVPAGLIINGTTIRKEAHEVIVFYHVELQRHGILLAEEAPAESYLDTGNRQQFSNCSIGYDPIIDAAANEPCAEMIFGGPRLAAIRDRLGAFSTVF